MLSHQFKDNVDDIVNQYRVQMGQKVIRRFNTYGGTKKFSTYEYRTIRVAATADWDEHYEVLARESYTGEGIDYHSSANNLLYKDVFRKYKLPFLDKTLEEWSDRNDPEVRVYIPFGGDWLCSIPCEIVGKFGYRETQPIRDGFTIDYNNQTLVFNEPIYLYQLNSTGDLIAIRRPEIHLNLWKKKYYSDTSSQSDDPKSDISNPLMFFTPKMGDYSQTIQKNLNLTSFSIQVGGSYRDNEGVWHYVPSWDDTAFALDEANLLLSQSCDIKKSGTISITLDAFCYFNIELANRIMINNVLDESLNIESISLNVSSFTASIQLQKNRYYARTISLQSRGE